MKGGSAEKARTIIVFSERTGILKKKLWWGVDPWAERSPRETQKDSGQRPQKVKRGTTAGDQGVRQKKRYARTRGSGKTIGLS